MSTRSFMFTDAHVPLTQLNSMFIPCLFETLKCCIHACEMLLLCSLLYSCLLNPSRAQSTCSIDFTSKIPQNYTVPADTFTRFATTVTSDDARYDELRRHGNNGKLLSNAAFIVRPETTEDVVRLLREAVKYDIRPTVRSGGHCYEDFWTENPGGILFDLSKMDKLYRDPPNDPDGTIWVEPGVRTGRLLELLWKDYGLTVPAAACPEVAVGGSVVGGAYGYLSRKFGLIIDFVDRVEIVRVKRDKSVESVLVGRNSTSPADQAVFWGILGGGVQNFGIVTKIGFQNLPPAPPIVYMYSAAWTLEKDLNESQFFNFMERFGTFFEANSGTDSEYCDLSFVGIDFLPESNKSTLHLLILLTGENQTLVENFMASLGLTKESFSCSQMSGYQFLFNKSSPVGPWRNDHYTRNSAYLVGGFTSRHIEALWNGLTSPQYSRLYSSQVSIRGYGCAVSRKAQADTAYPHRNAKMKMQFGAIWRSSDDRNEHEKWLSDLYLGMFGPEGPTPNNVTDGCYVNYPNRDLPNWRRLYYKDNYERLKEVKRAWDPLNVFKYRQSVELT